MNSISENDVETVDNVVPSLSREHYAAVIAMIDAMCERGAVRGSELTTLGQLRADFSLVIERMKQVENDER